MCQRSVRMSNVIMSRYQACQRSKNTTARRPTYITNSTKLVPTSARNSGDFNHAAVAMARERDSASASHPPRYHCPSDGSISVPYPYVAWMSAAVKHFPGPVRSPARSPLATCVYTPPVSKMFGWQMMVGFSNPVANPRVVCNVRRKGLVYTRHARPFFTSFCSH